MFANNDKTKWYFATKDLWHTIYFLSQMSIEIYSKVFSLKSICLDCQTTLLILKQQQKSTLENFAKLQVNVFDKTKYIIMCNIYRQSLLGLWNL